MVLVGAYAERVHDLVSPVETSYSELREEYRASVSFPEGALVIGIPVAYGYYLDDPGIDFRSILPYGFDRLVGYSGGSEAMLVAMGRRPVSRREDALPTSA